MLNPYVPSSEAYRGMIYTHVLNRGGHGVQNPADRLLTGPLGGVDPQGSRVNTPSGDMNNGGATA
jgi:hypothetical protein